VVDMNNDLLRTGDKGLIRFRYMYRPEYLKVGTTVLFREGRTKGLGVVSRVFPPSDKLTGKLAGINN
jgi:GTPase